MAGTIVWRVGVGGAEQARADLRSLGDAGAAGAAATEKAWTEAGAATDAQLARLRRQNDSYQASVQQQSAQHNFNQTLGVDRSAPSARASASVFAEQLGQMEQLEARAKTLKSSLDPLYAAQEKYAGAVGEATTLLGAGVISETEHAAATGAARKALEEAEKAARAAGAGFSLSGAQMMELEHSARAVTDAVIAGRNPIQALTMEGGRLAQVMGEGSGGLGGSLAALRVLALGPVGVFGALAAAILIAASAERSYAEAQLALQRSLDGAGRESGATTAQLEAIAEAAGHAGNVSVAAARSMEAAFLSTGKIGSESLAGLIEVSRDYSAAMGVNAKQATQDLAKAFADPARGADELNEKLHFLDDTTREHIREMAEAGDRAGAQALMMEKLQGAVDGAANHLSVLDQNLHNIATGFANAWNWAGQFLNRLHELGGPELQQLNAQIAAMQAAPLLLDPGRLKQLIAQRDALQSAPQNAVEAQQNEVSTRAGDVARQYEPEIAERERMQAQLKEVQAAAASGFRGVAPDAVASDKRLLDALPRAIATAMSEHEREGREAEIRAELAARPGSSKRAELQGELVQIQIAGQVLTPAEAAARVASGREQGANRGERVDQRNANRENTAEKESQDAVSKALEATAKAQETIATAKAQEAAADLSALAGDASLTADERRARMAQAASELAIQNAKDDQLALELRRIEDERKRQLSDVAHQTTWSAGQRDTASRAIDAQAKAQTDAAREQDAARRALADTAAQTSGNGFAAQALTSRAGDQGASTADRVAAERQLLDLQQAEIQARTDTVLSAKGVSDATRQRVLAEMRAAEAAAPMAAAAAQIRELQGSELDAAKALATTSDERNAIAREQLEISQKQRDTATQVLVAQLDQAVAAGAMAKAMRDQLATTLNASRGNLDALENESLRRQQLTPLGKLYDASSQQSPRDMAEQDAASGMSRVSTNLVELAEGTETFKKALKDVAGSLEGEVLKQISDRALAPVDRLIDQGIDKLFPSISNTSMSSASAAATLSVNALAQAASAAALRLTAVGYGGGAGGVSGLSGLFSGGGANDDFAAADDDAWVTAAGGGHVRGPGSGTSDSIPARLSDGEFVVNAAATDRHLDLLHSINSGHLPGYADGGYVGDDSWPHSRQRHVGVAWNVGAPSAGGSAGGGGDVHLHNHTGQPMQAKTSRNGKGDLAVVLTPTLKKGVQGMGQDGSLERVMKTMPRTLKQRA